MRSLPRSHGAALRPLDARTGSDSARRADRVLGPEVPDHSRAGRRDGHERRQPAGDRRERTRRRARRGDTARALRRRPARRRPAAASRSAPTSARWRSATKTARCVSWTCEREPCAPRRDRHGGAVTAIAFTPDGRSLVSPAKDGDVIMWDVSTRQAVETLVRAWRRRLRVSQITSDGETLYSASLDGSVFVWDLDGARRLGRPFRAGVGNGGNPRYAQSSDGRLLATGQEDGAVSIVDARTLKPRAAVPVVRAESRSRRLRARQPSRRRRAAATGSSRSSTPTRDVCSTAFAATTATSDARHQRRRAAAHHRRQRGQLRFWSLPDGGRSAHAALRARDLRRRS